MNTIPALPPVVYLAGRYMTSLDMFMAKVRDVLSSTRRNALMEQEHLLALYRDGVLLDWLRTLSPTDHRAASMHRSMEKMMQQTMTDTEAKKALGNLFGAKEARVTALRFDEYLELLPECMVRINRKSFKQSIDSEIDLTDVEDDPVVITLSFRVLRAANDMIPVAFGKREENIPLHTKGKIHNVVFKIILPDGDSPSLELTSSDSKIHTFKFIFNEEWVDLGFGVKWATCNVGAKYPWETGDRFSWGTETAFDKIYLKTTFSIFESIFRKPGSKCCMPKMEHFKQLHEKCYIKECNIHNIRCLVFTSKKNNKSIILPKKIEYINTPISLWSSTPFSTDTAYHYVPQSNPCLDIGNKGMFLPVRLICIS